MQVKQDNLALREFPLWPNMWGKDGSQALLKVKKFEYISKFNGRNKKIIKKHKEKHRTATIIAVVNTDNFFFYTRGYGTISKYAGRAMGI